jgi:hypothetical protein
MLKLLRSLLPGSPRNTEVATVPAEVTPPTEIEAPGANSLDLLSHLSNESGFPILDWEAALAWVNSIPTEEERGLAWSNLERAWLRHMQSALGASYALQETKEVFLLSTLAPNVANATLTYVSKTLQRVVRVLDGIAKVPEWGKDILIVFEDDEPYYQYVAHYYAAGGEFAASSGMFISKGCGHFVTVKSDLRMIEPVVAHELTHGCVSHLPIPAWLNEGLAVSTEHRLSPQGPPPFTPHQMHAKHLAFWGEAEIQEFWSGKSFLRPDDGNMLSYDLARILVSQLSKDWQEFRAFALNANLADAGSASAREHLKLDLGAAVSAILEREPSGSYAPNPAKWHTNPERGAF